MLTGVSCLPEAELVDVPLMRFMSWGGIRRRLREGAQHFASYILRRVSCRDSTGGQLITRDGNDRASARPPNTCENLQEMTIQHLEVEVLVPFSVFELRRVLPLLNGTAATVSRFHDLGGVSDWTTSRSMHPSERLLLLPSPRVHPWSRCRH